MTAKIIALYDSDSVANRKITTKGGKMGQTLEKPQDSSRNSSTAKEPLVDMASVRNAAAQVSERITAFTDKLAAEIGAELAKK